MKLKIHLLTVLIGLLFLVTYFLSDFLSGYLSIFYLILPVFFGFCSISFFVLALLKKNRVGIFIGALIFGIFLSSELLNSEIFKSKRILEATLIDDQSAMHLTLRADKKFEMESSNLLSEKIYNGNYQLIGNKIIFKDKRDDNNFIPDTVSIIGDKIIIRFDKSGQPITDFARYFDIKRNEIK